MFAVKKPLIFIFVICVCFSSVVFGQSPRTDKYPSAVLVQLKAERNRINALIKAKEYNALETFKKDVNGVMMATIRDFWDHFDYCPVYYYIDTNFDAVINRKFKGVLLDEHLSIVHNPLINDSSNTHIIVYFGDPTWQTKKRYWDTTKAANAGSHPNGRGLIINDYSMRQINYLYTIDYDFFNFRKIRNKNLYRYSSRKFNLEYIPHAAELNRIFKAPRKKNNKIKYRR